MAGGLSRGGVVAQILDQLQAWITQIVLALGYPGIVLVMFVENIFPPIPSEIIMPFAGFLVAEGEFSCAGVLISGTLGALIGAFLIYYLGLRADEQSLRRWFARYGRFLLMSEEDFDRALYIFERNGKKMVLVGRVVPTVRSLISLPAGMVEMNLFSFFLLTTLGTVIWNAVLACAGMMLGENWERVLDFIDHYQTVMGVLLVVLVVIFVVRRLRD